MSACETVPSAWIMLAHFWSQMGAKDIQLKFHKDVELGPLESKQIRLTACPLQEAQIQCLVFKFPLKIWVLLAFLPNLAPTKVLAA